MKKPFPVPFIELSHQRRLIRKELDRALKRVIDSDRFVLSEEVKTFEAAIEKTARVGHAIGVASGTDALYLSLWAVGVKPGDEVITTPFTFFATGGAISRLGAKPVFVDVEADTFNIDPRRVEAAVTARTRAIIPVHLYGLCADMDPILSIAKKRGLSVIEDAAQAYGASYKGKMAGSMGDAGCYSFYPTKNLGGLGDGGMVVTSRADLNEKIRVCRDNGSRRKYIHDFIGVNSRLDELQAAALNVKLKHIAAWTRERQDLAAEYARGLKGLPLEVPFAPIKSGHVYHLYTIKTEHRDALAAHLGAHRIGCGIYYPLPLHLQPCYADLGYRKGSLPVAESLPKVVLSLPMYNGLKPAAVRAVTACIRDFFAKHK